MRSDKPIVNREWTMDQLRWSLQALASPREVQVAVFPDFVCVADELALEFDGRFHVATENFGAEMTVDQRLSLAAINRRLSAMSKDGPDWSSELWEAEALSSNPHWQEIRSLAKKALLTFGWPVENPGPVSGTYVEGREEERTD